MSINYYSTATVYVQATTIQNTQVQVNASTPCSSGNACLPSSIPINANITSNQDVMLVALYATAVYNNEPNTVVQYVGATGTNLSAQVIATVDAPYTPSAPCHMSKTVPVTVNAIVCVPYLLTQGYGILARNPTAFATALNINNIQPADLPKVFPNACTLVTGQVNATINVDCAIAVPSDTSSTAQIMTEPATTQSGVPTPSSVIQSVFNIPPQYYAAVILEPTNNGLILSSVIFNPKTFVGGISNIACGTQTNACFTTNGVLTTPVDVILNLPLASIGLSNMQIRILTITNIYSVPVEVVLDQNLGPVTFSGDITTLFTNNGWTVVQKLTAGYFSYTYLTNNNLYITVTASGASSGTQYPVVLVLAVPTTQQVVPVPFELEYNLMAYGTSSNNQPLLALVGLDYSDYSAFIVPTTYADSLTCGNIASQKNPFSNTAVLMFRLPLYPVSGAYSVNVWYVDVQDNNVGDAITVGAFIGNDFASGAAVDIISPTNKNHCILSGKQLPDFVPLSSANGVIVYILTPSQTGQTLTAGYPLIIRVIVNYNNVGGNLIAQVVYKVIITPKIPPASITSASATPGGLSITDLYAKNIYCGSPPPNCPTCPAPQICGIPLEAPFYQLQSYIVNISYTGGVTIPNTISISGISNLPIPASVFNYISSAMPISTATVKACLGNAAIGIGFGNPSMTIDKLTGLPTITIDANVWSCSTSSTSAINPTSVVLYSPSYLVIGGNNLTLSGAQANTTWADEIYTFIVPTLTSNGSVQLYFNDPDCSSISNVQPYVVKTGTVSSPSSLPIVDLPSSALSTLQSALASSSFLYNIPNWWTYEVCGPLTLVVKGSTISTVSLGNVCFVGYAFISNGKLFTAPLPCADACCNTVTFFINSNDNLSLKQSQITSLLSNILNAIQIEYGVDKSTNNAWVKIVLPKLIAILNATGYTLYALLEVNNFAIPLQCDMATLVCTVPPSQAQQLIQLMQQVGGQIEVCIGIQQIPGSLTCKAYRFTSSGFVPATTTPLPIVPIVTARVLTPKVKPDEHLKVVYTLGFKLMQTS